MLPGRFTCHIQGADIYAGNRLEQAMLNSSHSGIPETAKAANGQIRSESSEDSFKEHKSNPAQNGFKYQFIEDE
ncbi:MAG: hypothetical protein LBQ70_03680 [Prevotellaceae bacterium]|nr:hypothetical protein [Prevotellaceae bacterium]